MAEEMINGAPARTVYTTNYNRLKQEREPIFDHCREINKMMTPRTGRFFDTAPNSRPGRRNDGIYDNTATRGIQTTAASLLTTASSPARPWFRLSTGNKDLDSEWVVRVWLEDVRQKILDTFQESNVYQALHQMYQELVTYGTACAVMVEDLEDIVRLQVLTFGEYCLVTDSSGRVTALYRELRMTTEQLVKKFGESKCSSAVQQEFKNPGQLHNWHKVLHIVEPRDRYDPTKEDPQNRAWRSLYMELECGAENDSYNALLSESGYDQFPVLAPRWDVQGHDVYGMSPAMNCLGDVESLQQAQFRLHQAVDYKTKPPVALPTAMRGSEVDMNPGGKTYISGAQPAKSLFEVTLDIQACLELIRGIQDRINASLFVDVFLSLLSASDTTQRTAEEIRERRDEKFQLLGPVVDRMGTELHDPLITFTFGALLKRAELPQMPDVLSATKLRVEFVSVLAQAQKAIATVGTDRMMANVMAIGQTKPEIWDKIDLYYYVDYQAERLGVDPKITVPTDKAVAVAEARNRALAAQQQAMLAEQSSKAVKNVADASAASPQEPITGPQAAGLFSGSLGGP